MPEPFIKQLLRGKFGLTVYHPREQEARLTEWVRNNLDESRYQILGSSPVVQNGVKYSVLAFISELDARKFKNWAAEQKFEVKNFEDEDFAGWS